MKLQFVLLTEDATLPTRAHEGDAGLDLYSGWRYDIPPKSYAAIGTGVSVAIPHGYEGQIRGRSGLAFKSGIFCPHIGTIDYGYTGELMLLLYNATDTVFEVYGGDKVAQLVIAPIALAEPERADSLPETERGVFGFGSTGI